MERWYIAFNTVGSPRDTLERLVRTVREHQLGSFVVRFCYEKGLGRKRGQLYVFIGVESEYIGLIPDDVYHEFSTMLQRLRLADQGLYVYFDDVKKMVSDELEIHNLRQIKMLKIPPPQPAAPFTYEGSENTELSNDDNTARYNDLLYWLSVFGRGTWQQLRLTCQELGLDWDGKYSRRIARRLRSLGHLEMPNEGQNWFIAPPSLVEIESTTGQYCTFLAGQRLPYLVKTLEKTAHIEVESQPYNNAPPLVRVIFGSKAEAEDFVSNYTRQHHQLYLAGRADWKIAGILPDLHTWEKHLPQPTIIQSNYTFEMWLDGGFCPVELPRQIGLYRLSHVSTRFQHPQRTYFYDGESTQPIWREGDWYGLHYLMLRRTGVSCKFYYDYRFKTLSILREQRLPEIYERALVLASGRLPTYNNGNVIFSNVAEGLADLVARKLQAEFIEYKES